MLPLEYAGEIDSISRPSAPDGAAANSQGLVAPGALPDTRASDKRAGGYHRQLNPATFRLRNSPDLLFGEGITDRGNWPSSPRRTPTQRASFDVALFDFIYAQKREISGIFVAQRSSK